MQIEHGYWRWKIYRWDRHPNRFRGRADLALAWLQRFENDRRVMSELRHLLVESGNAMPRATDRQVLEDIAQRLAAGELHVCAESSHPFHHDTTEVKIPAESEEEPAAGPSPAPAPAPPPPPPAAQETLPEDADADKIADSLKEAAQNGTPFCEECKKAAGKAVRPVVTPASPGAAGAATQAVLRSSTAVIADDTVPPSQGGLSPDLDPVNFARVMKEAAASGQPFCEECERARLAAQQPRNG
jgi:hypothetical protein